MKKNSSSKENIRPILKLDDACFTCQNKIPIKDVGWVCAHPTSSLYKTPVKLINDVCEYHTPKLKLND